MDHESAMRRAVELSRVKMNEGEGGPFAALVLRDGEIVGEGWNQVTTDIDPTAHAEIVAIRDACRRLDTFVLEGCVIYSSCEPCPMCLAAIYWARLDALYYAAGRHDAAMAGFDDEFLYGQVALPPEGRELPTTVVLHDEAVRVLAEWDSKPDKVRY